MNKKRVFTVIAVAAAVVLGGYAAFEMGMRRGGSMRAPTDASASSPKGGVSGATGKLPQSIAEGEELLYECQKL